MSKVLCRAPGNYDPDEASDRAGLDTGPESRTQQSSKDEADINVIVKRFGVTGRIPVRNLPPMFGDFTGVADFRDAQDRILQARQAFMGLPADVRSRFGNDPASFVEFATNRDNLASLREMGLAPPVEAGDPSGGDKS